MGCSKSSLKREVNSNTVIPQETRKTSNRQPDFTPKTTGKRRTKKLQATDWDKISAKDTCDKGLVSNIYKELSKLNNKEQLY